MDGYHPTNSDPRPKRRRAVDNPYIIFSVGIDTPAPHYYISFRDSCGVRQCMEIDKLLFDTLDQFELDDLSYLNEVDRHYEHSEQTEESLNHRAFLKEVPLEETVQQKMEAQALHRAIAQLPEVQRRRLVLYYFGSLTYEQIAEMEGCTKRAIKYSVDLAIQHLRKIL